MICLCCKHSIDKIIYRQSFYFSEHNNIAIKHSFDSQFFSVLEIDRLLI